MGNSNKLLCVCVRVCVCLAEEYALLEGDMSSRPGGLESCTGAGLPLGGAKRQTPSAYPISLWTCSEWTNMDAARQHQSPSKTKNMGPISISAGSCNITGNVFVSVRSKKNTPFPLAIDVPFFPFSLLLAFFSRSFFFFTLQRIALKIKALLRSFSSWLAVRVSHDHVCCLF